MKTIDTSVKYNHNHYFKDILSQSNNDSYLISASVNLDDSDLFMITVDKINYTFIYYESEISFKHLKDKENPLFINFKNAEGLVKRFEKKIMDKDLMIKELSQDLELSFEFNIIDQNENFVLRITKKEKNVDTVKVLENLSYNYNILATELKEKGSEIKNYNNIYRSRDHLP